MSQIKFGSVCSGIEAASVAWHPLGWKAAWLSEIEKFPSQVLAHHYPNTPNFGDMTKFKEWSIGSDVNVLVGGTPCQSFSVAGLRKGLDDPRGNLMLTYLAIAAKYRPRWLVWENVPGVLSSNGGLDFASLLRGMGECGYGFAYRILDAQYFGVAQRRRRVFVVGYLGNWRPAAAVLFERHSLQGYPAPSREKGQRVAPTIRAGAANSSAGHGARSGDSKDELIVPIVFAADLSQKAEGVGYAKEQAPCLTSGTHPGHGVHVHQTVQPIALQDVRAVEKMQNGKGWNDDGTAYTVDTHATQGVMQPIPFQDTADCLTAAYGTKWNGNASADNGSLFVAQPIAFAQNTRDEVRLMNGDGSIVGALAANPGTKQTCYIAQPIAFDMAQITSKANGSRAEPGLPTGTLAKGSSMHVAQAVYELHSQDSRVRDVGDVCSTVSATYGAGGGNVPVTIQPIAFSRNDDGRDATHNLAPTMRVAGNAGGMLAAAVGTDLYNGAITGDVDMTQTLGAKNPMAVAVSSGHGWWSESDGTAQTLRAQDSINKADTLPIVGMAVRRLTPIECERLQGFPDGYTDIQPKGKATPDGPRYKALGNSMAVPVMAWIGKRIQQVEDILG